jgi:membrane-bound lytic murein transglycosylase MltF
MPHSSKTRSARWSLAISFLMVLGGGLFNGSSSTAVLIALTAETRESGGVHEHAAETESRCQERILQLVQAHRRSAETSWQRRLAEAIYYESLAAGVDPLTVASIVATESSFKSRAVSHAGAVGLMQLRPFVARDLARRHSVQWQGRETLHSPEFNLRLGILYYKELIARFGGDELLALTAYNMGPTRVSRQLLAGTLQVSAYATTILELRAKVMTGQT